MTTVFKQYRSVQVDDLDLSGYDVEVTVANPANDPLEYTVKVWNVNESGWESISAEDSAVAIELGWEDGPSEQVMLGTVEQTDVDMDGTDMLYTIEGQDASSSALTSRVRMSFLDTNIEGIVSQLASEVGLQVEAESVGQPPQSTYSVTTQMTVREALEELADYAGEITGDTWEFYAQRGTVYFRPTEARSAQVPELSYDGLLASVNKKENEDADVQLLDFKALLDPRFEQGATVSVSTDKFSGNYEVKSYDMQSSAQTGQHILQGTLEALSGPDSHSDDANATGGATGPGAGNTN